MIPTVSQLLLFFGFSFSASLPECLTELYYNPVAEYSNEACGKSARYDHFKMAAFVLFSQL